MKQRWIRILVLLPLAVLVVLALAVLIRWQIASAQVNRDSAALKASSKQNIGETSKLDLIPLYDGAAFQPEFQTGLGVSYLIQTDSATILFDVGNNPENTGRSPLEMNMDKLGLSLDPVDLIVISHGHYDHTGGQRWLSQGTFSIGGSSQASLGGRPIYVPQSMTYPGSSPMVARNATKIAEGVATTGVIPFVNPFPAWLVMPGGTEQALAVNVKGLGIILITGCGHMGLNSLLAHAQASFDAPVVGVIGGLHEGPAGAKDLAPQIQLLQDLNPAVIAISPHDSGAAARNAFQQAFPEAYQNIEVGQKIKIP
jgi:7,8-dihydropterin-6-yl-methyl-4-(beta-D-ribofuranosyl)aminobenzene 5'-phosphate synthase